MEQKKFLILLFYYDRPKIVQNALYSLNDLDYTNFEVAFIDDGSSNPGKPVAEEILSDDILKRVMFYNTNDSMVQKINQGGSIFGKYANIAIQESDAEYVIMLCDDDAIVSTYLTNLNEYYTCNSDIPWAYSKVFYYNPEIETYLQSTDNLERVRYAGSIVDLNKHNAPMNPDCACDASQVSFRRSCFVNHDSWFPYPQTRNLDSAIYSKMYNVLGNCFPTNFYGQYKGVFSDQLGCRSNYEFNVSIK